MRRAAHADVPSIARLLADDFLGAKREPLGEPLARGYYEAFQEIDADPNSRLFVAEADGQVVGTFQLSFMRRMSRGGHRVCEIESVHVASERRNLGIGTAMIKRALEEATAAGCIRLQLTSDQQRTRAHGFYERLGFLRSHFGFKRAI